MAKISARGATKVESIKSVLHETTEALGVVTIHVTHTLCSDGRILRNFDGSGYRKVAKVSASASDPIATFRAYVRRYEAARS
jgi:hypothetical protein